MDIERLKKIIKYNLVSFSLSFDAITKISEQLAIDLMAEIDDDGSEEEANAN